ncbi:MAG: hypothetical protein DPW09_15635 [Anaerolineae bacterium]|nr:hypothetical protein [Anaerolineae bacterium]
MDITTGIVRVLDSHGQTAGTGFVLTNDSLIATCAHMIESAGAGPGETVRLRFHLTGDEATAIIELDGWRNPDAEDIAILRLNGPLPKGIMPLPLGLSTDSANHPFETFGFPDANPNEGLWGSGHILRQTTLNRVRMLQLQSQEVTPGFSGAPIWDTITQCVVGIVTAITTPDQYGRLTQTAFATPTEVLLKAWPTLPITAPPLAHTTFLPPPHPNNLRPIISPGIRPGQVPPFHELGEYVFQELCRDLFDAEPGIATCEIYGTRGQSQEGIDLLAYRADGNGIEVGQCKCYARFSPRQIREASDEFLAHWQTHWAGENVKRFILFVACDLSNRKQQDEINKQWKRFKKIGIIYEVWSASKIRNKLRLHRGIVASYLSPPEHWVQVICGTILTPSPLTGAETQSSSVVSAVLTSQIEQLAAQLSGETERRLEMMRIAWREGRKGEAAQWLAEIMNDKVRWPVLSPDVKAKLLCFQSSLELDTTGDLQRVKQLADEARRLAPTNNEIRLRAFIAYMEADLMAAVELLAEQTDLDSLNLRAAILLEMGRIAESQTILALESLGTEPNAETFRLRALSYLAIKDVSQAQLEIQKALALGPRWESVRFAAATINYFSALSSVALPDRLVPWAEPVDWASVKRDDESLARLRAAAEIFNELAEGTEKTGEERQKAAAWRLACLANDPERQETAISYCRAILTANPANYQTIAWAMARQFDIDLTPSQTALEQLIANGAATVFHIIALLSCYLTSENAQKAIKLLDDTRPTFQKQQAEALWIFWHVQSLVATGDHQAALIAINHSGRQAELRHAQTMVLSALAETSGDWQPVIRHLESSYEETGDPNFLLDSCLLMTRQQEWTYVADRAEHLVVQVATGEAVRLAAVAAHHAGRFKLCLKLLNEYQHCFRQHRLPAELRRLRAFCLFRIGNWSEAITEADALAREEPTPENLLPLAQFYFTKGDTKGLAIATRQIDYLPQLDPNTALQTAQMVPVEDQDLAVSLWRKAISQALPDSLVGDAILEGFRRDLDQEMQPLMARMFELGQQGQFDIQVLTIKDFIGFAKAQHERAVELSDIYQKGTAPSHLILEQVNRPLIDFYHDVLAQNETAPDPIRQNFLLARHGGRGLMAGFPDNLPTWRLNLDITAVLLAEHLNLLDGIEKTFAPLHIPQHVLLALRRMQDRLTFHQPSRLRAGEQILELVKCRQLQVNSYELPPTNENQQLIEELGEEWVALFEHVQANQGYLVDFLPLQKRDLNGPPAALPTAAEDYLVNCRAVVEALYQQGLLSDQQYIETLKRLGEEGRQAPTPTMPAKGSLLFCHGGIAEVLADADLLQAVCGSFRVHITSQVFDQVRGMLEYHSRRRTVAEWLDRLINRLNQGLDDGIYQIVVPTSRAEDIEKEAAQNPDIGCPLTLLVFEAREGDVIWADDRWFNSYLRRDHVPIIGINEVLKALVSAGAMTLDDYYAKLSRLRAANVRFIPIQSDDILYHLRQAKIDKGAVVETEDLTILRRYVAACLWQGRMLQRPPVPKGVSNPDGEVAFIVGLEREVSKALVGLWMIEDIKEETRRAYGEWLLSNVYLNLLALSQVTEWPRTEQNEQYLIAVSLVGLIAPAVSLETSQTDEVDSVRRNFFDWLFHRVLRTQFDNDPHLVPMVADLLKQMLLNFRQIELPKEVPDVAVIRVLQNFFDDLPQPLKDAMVRDADFMASLDFKPTTPVEDLHFDPNAFWSAATEAINGRPATIVALKLDQVVTFEPMDEPHDQPAFSFKHPVSQEKRVVHGHELAVLLDSPQEREAALRRQQHWFDCPDGLLEQAIAEIMTVDNPQHRIEAVNAWREASGTVYYARLHRQLKQQAGFQLSDLLPPSADGLLRFFRLTPYAKPDAAFQEALAEAAHMLIHQEGLYVAINRLASLPVYLPEVLIEAVAALSPGERRSLIKRLLATAGSPLSQAHILYLLRRFGHTTQSYQRLARQIIQSLLSDEGTETLETFFTLLRWISNEFERWPEMSAWPSHLRLAMIWGHSHQLFTIFMAAGAPLDLLRDTFSRPPQRVSPEVIEHQSDYWFDIAHPRHVNRSVFLVAALAYGLDETADEFVQMGLSENLIQLTFTTIEGIQIPALPLLRDTGQASNRLASFLDGNRGEQLTRLLGKEKAEIFTRSSLRALAEQTADTLTKDSYNSLAWAWVEVLLGDLPPREDLATRLKTVIDQTDVVALVKENVDLGCLAMLVASQQAIHLEDEALRQRLKDELVQIFSVLAEVDLVEMEVQAENGEGSNAAQLLYLRLFESTLNLSIAAQTEPVTEFSDIMMHLAEAWPAMAPTMLKPIIQRLCEELPISQAKYLWPVLVRLRAK